jgi:uncharacterized protein (DUF885 family)
MRHSIQTLAALTLAVLSAGAQTRAVIQSRIDRLHQLIDEQWEYTLRNAPEFASIVGEKRYNDKLTDFSQQAVDRNLAKTRNFLKRFEAISTAGLPEQEKLNRDLMVRSLRETIEAAQYKDWEMPVTQFGGPHIDLPQLVPSLSFASVKDYEDYVARLHQIPRLFREMIMQMRKGMAEGLIPPRIILEQVMMQADKIARQKPEETPFAVPTTQFPKEFADAERVRPGTVVLTAIRDSVLPAYDEFVTFVRDEYAPRGRSNIGVWALPSGKARYAFAVRQMTTTKMTPAQIHELGLREVARIEHEQTVIALQLGFADLRSFRDAIQKMPNLHPASREAILDEYRRYETRMSEKLPELFGRLPKAKLEVLPVEPFREKEASTASYDQGTPDGSRPGRVFVNTYDFANQLTIGNESLAYHTGVPGHHLQTSIAQEQSALPPFRQQATYTAYVEGWAVYCEQLGKEVGFYTGPYSEYGRLDVDMLRAIRLVVDTGIHDRHWTREQAVAFFHEHSSSNEAEIQAEIDRYIAWPAQALAYKVGQLTILRLRERMKESLGAKFDIRAFHDEVLGAGALPLDVLEQRIMKRASKSVS